MSVGDVERIADAIAAGLSLAATARVVGCSVSTVQRRLRDPAVVALIEERCSRRREADAAAWQRRQDRAGRVLEDSLESDDERLRLRAAQMVFRTAEQREFIHDTARRQAVINELILRRIADDAKDPDE